jgi:hypothetical protein
MGEAPAARVSAANALLDRGYGKPQQHITADASRSFVIRAPLPCATSEEWEAEVRAQGYGVPATADGGEVAIGDDGLAAGAIRVHRVNTVAAQFEKEQSARADPARRSHRWGGLK